MKKDIFTFRNWKKHVPEEVERLKKRVYALLPHLPLADLLLEVDNWTGFLRHFTHLTSGDAPIGTQKLELVAALMGMGMNLGLEKMAESCPYTYRQLSWSIDWHIREETLLAALANLDNFVLAAPLSSAWGDGTTSSSDGMRIHVGVQAANAERNAKYGWRPELLRERAGHTQISSTYQLYVHPSDEELREAWERTQERLRLSTPLQEER